MLYCIYTKDMTKIKTIIKDLYFDISYELTVIKDNIIRFIQRGFRGYADEDAESIERYLADVTSKMVLYKLHRNFEDMDVMEQEDLNDRFVKSYFKHINKQNAKLASIYDAMQSFLDGVNYEDYKTDKQYQKALDKSWKQYSKALSEIPYL